MRSIIIDEKKIKVWMNKHEMAELVKHHPKTIERRRIKLLKENPDLKWFNTKVRPYKYHYKMLSEWLSPMIFNEIVRSRQKSNTIECLFSKKETLEYRLSQMHWDYFVTIAYEEALNKDRCFTVMHQLYEDLKTMSFGSDVAMFFTTEPFTNRKGCHNHFVLRINAEPELLRDFIQEKAPKGRVDLKRYDRELAGVFYICKDGIKDIDWDLPGVKQESDNASIQIAA